MRFEACGRHEQSHKRASNAGVGCNKPNRSIDVFRRLRSSYALDCGEQRVSTISTTRSTSAGRVYGATRRKRSRTLIDAVWNPKNGRVEWQILNRLQLEFKLSNLTDKKNRRFGLEKFATTKNDGRNRED